MQSISILNESSLVGDEELQNIATALQVQVSRDFAPIWGIDAHVYFLSKGVSVPAGAWSIVVLDDSDQADALGYHELGPNGEPMGKVFAAADRDAGTSLSVTLSHELLEMLGDPDANLCAQVGDVMYAYEACDAVEADGLGYEIDGVLVSDFITPAWFCPGGSGPFDFKEHLTSSLQMAPGGYTSLMHLNGRDHWQQITMRTRGNGVPKGSRRDKRRKARALWQWSRGR